MSLTYKQEIYLDNLKKNKRTLVIDFAKINKKKEELEITDLSLQVIKKTIENMEEKIRDIEQYK